MHTSSKNSLVLNITTRVQMLVPTWESRLRTIDGLIAIDAFDQAAERLDRMAESKDKEGNYGNGPDLSLLRAKLAYRQKNYNSALEWSQNAVSQNKEGPAPMGVAGLAHLHQHHSRTALTVFDAISAMHLDSSMGPLGQAGILLLSDLQDAAEIAITMAAKRENTPLVKRVADLIKQGANTAL